ncbi:hypothetical protein Celaphus_00006785, partial [Cervus elaphus hippelaphus]
LVLPRLALPVGHYCFVFLVSFGDTPLARSIQANVTVAAERLVPIVEGGSSRVWSDSQDLVLDGSKSYDPNLEDGDQTPLSFHWACVSATQSETGGCALNFGPRGSSVVTIPRERLRAGVEYTFNLTVWKAGRKEEVTSQTVLVRSGRLPIVSLECVSCKAQAVYAVSRSSYVYLEGRCDNCDGGSERGEPVVGLVLWASRKVVEPGQPVHFQILLAAGSAVRFLLQVGGGGLEVLPAPHFSRSFPRVGDYTVSVHAENRVSRAQAQVRISVLEAVGGLQVPDCCGLAIATGAERNFSARVQRGSRVAYAWYFSLQKVQGDSLVILSGRDVTYTPVAAGLLEIHVRAFNELGGVNCTLRVEVQDAIQHVALRGPRCFANRSAHFEAATSPSARRVTYRWDFGDGAPVEDTEVPWAAHSYLQPGDYRVQVNASNLVSFFVAQATVTVHVLACREPAVDVALPPQVLMRRSQRNYLEAHVDLRDCVSYQTEYRWEDAEDAGAPLVYVLQLRRCRQGHCEEFCVYKGSLASYGAVLPPGFAPHFVVGLAVLVQDQLGAAVVALNRSLTITLPDPPGDPADGPPDLTGWLHSLAGSTLPGLLRQADPQHVMEYSLALIAVLNEPPLPVLGRRCPLTALCPQYEQTLPVLVEPDPRQELRAQIRKNITETLVSLRVNTVDDIQQVAAALAQCTVSSRELVCRSCLKKTLHRLEDMMRILQAETATGAGTPTAIADSILNITGDLIHVASSDVQGPQPSELGAEPPSLLVASRAYQLSSALVGILTRSRVLNEEPLTLAGEEILAQGKRSDPRSLLCQGDAPGPGCHFSIPEAFSAALPNLSDVVQLILLVDSNPFPFGYISNYTVSTKVASMAFQTQAGAQIPIRQLASERAITVKVPNNSDQAAQGQRVPAGSAVIQPRAS